MIRRLVAALGATALLGSPSLAGAFTLLSPPQFAPKGGFFECAISNDRADRPMSVVITIVDEDGDAVESSDQICNGTFDSFCFRAASGVAAREAARGCRFDVSQGSKKDIRASSITNDSTFTTAVTLEAR